MARIRTFKPEFFKSEDTAALPFRTRLTWLGLWTQCDDHGRYKDSARLIKGDLWSLEEVSLRDIEEDLSTLAAHGRIVRYEVAGRRYLAVVNWHAHQAINRPSKAKHPAPPIALATSNPDDVNFCSSGECAAPGAGSVVPASLAPAEQCASEPRETARTTHGGLTEPSLNLQSDTPDTAPSYPQENLTEPSLSPHARKGKEGKGREGTRTSAQEPPSPQCTQHANDPDPGPCGACGDARRARKTWDQDQARTAATTQQRHARTRAETVRAAIDACRVCDTSGYVGIHLCSHDPDTDRAHRGAAAAAAALRRAPTPASAT